MAELPAIAWPILAAGGFAIAFGEFALLHGLTRRHQRARATIERLRRERDALRWQARATERK